MSTVAPAHGLPRFSFAPTAPTQDGPVPPAETTPGKEEPLVWAPSTNAIVPSGARLPVRPTPAQPTILALGPGSLSQGPAPSFLPAQASLWLWASCVGVGGAVMAAWSQRGRQASEARLTNGCAHHGQEFHAPAQTHRHGKGVTLGAMMAVMGMSALWLVTALSCVPTAAAHFDAFGNHTHAHHVRGSNHIREEVRYGGDERMTAQMLDARLIDKAKRYPEIGRWNTRADGGDACAQRNEENSACLTHFFLAEHAPPHQFWSAYLANQMKRKVIGHAWKWLPRPQAEEVHFALHDAYVSLSGAYLRWFEEARGTESIFTCTRPGPKSCHLPLSGDHFRNLLRSASRKAQAFERSEQALLVLDHCTDEKPGNLLLRYHAQFEHNGFVTRTKEEWHDVALALENRATPCQTFFSLRPMHNALRLDDAKEDLVFPVVMKVSANPDLFV